jgi:hypothetical protein
VTVSDSAEPEAEAELELSIEVTLPLTISTTTLPGGTLENEYEQEIVVTGGTEPYSFSVSSGALPAGLSLDPETGEITGEPTAAATSNFGITVSDSSNPQQTATRNLKIAITPPLEIEEAPLPGGSLQTPYSASIVVSGGTAPYTWTRSAGTLPAGLTLNSSTGVISGTPTAAATTLSFVVAVTDSSTPQLSTNSVFRIPVGPR